MCNACGDAYLAGTLGELQAPGARVDAGEEEEAEVKEEEDGGALRETTSNKSSSPDRM